MDTPSSARYKLLSFFGLLCLASASPANANYNHQSGYCIPRPCLCPVVASNMWYLDTNVGRSFDYGRNINSTFVADSWETIYGRISNYGGTPKASFFSVGAGYVWSRNTDYFPFLSAGLQYRYTVPITIGAALTDLNQPQLQDLGSYKLAQQSYLVQGKADIYRWGFVMPYVSLGLGTSLNRISQFYVQEMDGIAVVSNANTSTNFSYSVGAGLDFPIREDFWVTLGYSFDYFGKTQKNLVPQPQTDPPIAPLNISNNNLHAQSVQLGVRYLFA